MATVFDEITSYIKREVGKKGPGVFILPGLLKVKRVEKPATKARQGRNPQSAADFETPVRLKVGDAAIRVENPGYASPCWADINGKKHLLVGQFSKGKIRMFKHLGAEKFAPGQWLQADESVAEVPGVW